MLELLSGSVISERLFQVNTLNNEVSTEFRDVIKKIQNDNLVKAVVLISSKPDCFIAGADIGSAEIVSLNNILISRNVTLFIFLPYSGNLSVYILSNSVFTRSHLHFCYIFIYFALLSCTFSHCQYDNGEKWNC